MYKLAAVTLDSSPEKELDVVLNHIAIKMAEFST